MKHHPFYLVLLCAWTAITSSQAQTLPTLPPSAAIVPGERLSDWLLRAAAPGADTTGLHWRVNAERAPQTRLKQAVLADLQAQQPAHENLADWFQRLPVTGRLTVAIADARWLQANPLQDPVLTDGHQLLLFKRPALVTVLSESGMPCLVVHKPDAPALDYVQACNSALQSAADWAWISQPDGRTFRVGMASWNTDMQPLPAPGAWIWAPANAARIAPHVSDNLARFLATQLPGELLMPPGTLPVQVPAQPNIHVARSAELTASDWGEIGLLQTPTARMAPTGSLRMHINSATPYLRATAMFQPMDWLEGGFRYTDIANRLYGAEIAGSQTYKDKSIDVKVRLLEESGTLPQVAAGLRDVGGTGLFSAEYVVANKRWGDWDASLGFGWGYLSQGARSNTAAAGAISTGSMFKGPAAVFGGLQWQLPTSGWLLKAEFEGNTYRNEPLSSSLPATSRFNLGAVYRYSPGVDFSFGYERGNQIMLGLTLHTNVKNLATPKTMDLPAPPPAWQPMPAAGAFSAQATAQALEQQTGWEVSGLELGSSALLVVAETDGALFLQRRIDHAVGVLNQYAPAHIQRFDLALKERGLHLSHIEIDRTQWQLANNRSEPPSLRLPAQRVSPGHPVALPDGLGPQESATVWAQAPQSFHAEWGPSYRHILGGPDSFVLYQLGVQASLEQRLNNNTWIKAEFNQRLLDNYDNFVYTAPSALPRVRTYQREYVVTSATTMPLLQATHVQDLGGGHYASLYGGMLESMFGGVGAEWLYRPWRSRFALGVDANHVRQRDFRQNLQFRDYRVNTGHATLYWDTGWNDLQVKASVGQYLAGDRGATLELNRVFPNGITAGVWATKTNVSAAQFGEGSFDKGIYLTIPFDVLLPKSSAGNAAFVWNPLTRDGGARLDRRYTLHELTRQRGPRALKLTPVEASKPMSAEDKSYVLRP